MTFDTCFQVKELQKAFKNLTKFYQLLLLIFRFHFFQVRSYMFELFFFADVHQETNEYGHC